MIFEFPRICAGILTSSLIQDQLKKIHYEKFNQKLFPSLLWSLLLLFIGYHPLDAQSPNPEKKWNFLADVYLMFPYMDGETGIGESLILPVDANPGDIFSHLQMGAMLYLEAKTDKWAVTSDLGGSRTLPHNTFPGGGGWRPSQLPLYGN